MSLRTVSRMGADGLPVIHVHERIYRVHRDAFDQFLKQRTVAASPSDLNGRVGYNSKYSTGELKLLAMKREGQQKKKCRASRLREEGFEGRRYPI